MKTKILLGAFLSLSTIAVSQQNPDTPLTDGIQKFECKKLVLQSEKNKILLLGNVNCKTEKLEITKAKKVQFDQKTNTIIAYDAQSVTFDGSICFSAIRKQKNTFIYTIGDDSAFIR